MEDLRITLTGAERSDGTIHFTSAELPGFHFILGPDERPHDVLLPTVMQFAQKYYAAKLRRLQEAKPILREPAAPSRRRLSPHDLELCLA